MRRTNRLCPDAAIGRSKRPAYRGNGRAIGQFGIGLESAFFWSGLRLKSSHETCQMPETDRREGISNGRRGPQPRNLGPWLCQKKPVTRAPVRHNTLQWRTLYQFFAHIVIRRIQENIVIVGLPDAAVKESRDRVMTALNNSSFNFPSATINLAPRDVKKDGSSFDLPIPIGMVAASEQRGSGPGGPWANQRTGKETAIARDLPP